MLFPIPKELDDTIESVQSYYPHWTLGGGAAGLGAGMVVYRLTEPWDVPYANILIPGIGLIGGAYAGHNLGKALDKKSSIKKIYLIGTILQRGH